MNTRTLFIAIAIAGTGAVASPAGAHTSDPTSQPVTKTVDVVAPYQDVTNPGLEGLRCDHFSANEPRCRILSNGTARWTGTLRGEASFVLDLWPDESLPGQFFYEGFGDQGNHFVDVEIEGCGRGGFQMEEWDGRVALSPPADYNVATNKGAGFNRWRVRPGSGTGQLVGLTGSGVNNWTYHSAYSPVQYGNYGEGVFTGTLTCSVPATTTQSASTSVAASQQRRGRVPTGTALPVLPADGEQAAPQAAAASAASTATGVPTLPVRLAASPRSKSPSPRPWMLEAAVLCGVVAGSVVARRSRVRQRHTTTAG